MCLIARIALGAAGVLALAACGPDGGNCSVGSQACECYANATCDDGLQCHEGECVSDVAAPQGSNGPPGAGAASGVPCTDGDEGCSCYPNDTCNGGLVCTAGTCHSEAGAGANGGSGAEPGGTSDAGGAQGAAGAAGETGDPGCVPDCDGRACGPDPVCGVSCGDCAGSCDAGGQCMAMTTNGPMLLSFNANTRLLEYRSSLVFTAVLTDPDGVDDLIGGTLSDAQSGAAYGSFQTAATEGSYSLSVSWDELNAVIPIHEVPPSGVERTFRAEFFDQAGNMASVETSVTLRCSDPGTTGRLVHGCCNGEQMHFLSTQSSERCGSCELASGSSNVCPRGPEWAEDPYSDFCSNFRCEWKTPIQATRESCATVCSSVGASCVDGNPYTYSVTSDGSDYIRFMGEASYIGAETSSSMHLLRCDETPPAMDAEGNPFTRMWCRCGQTPPPDWFGELSE